jgi:adenosylcobinamide-GDP ribazoletransferase
VPSIGAWGTWVVVVGLVAALAAWAGLEWWRGLVAAALACLVVVLLLRVAVRRLGGVTGDVYGASIELALATLLLGLV